ncbi:MAG: family 16 glycosylhydrolase [Akkermansia sp.]
MKLHLSLKLRAALMACYRFAAPLVLTMATAGSFSHAADTDSTAPGSLDGGWVYVWGDEFNGDTLDESKWDYELGVVRNPGTQQVYTEDAVTVNNGNLTITSTYVGEGSDGVYNVNYIGDDYDYFVYNTEYLPYSSGSVTTKDTYEFQYGRLEVSAKLPDATGAWPAIWMMGTSLYGGDKWPTCGEIDILEHISQHDGLVYTTLHFTNSGLEAARSDYTYQFDPNTWYDDYHVFAMEWTEEDIKIFVDDFCIAIFDFDSPVFDFVNGENPFEDPQFLILNTAIGGTWCELADDPSEYPVEYLIDYVRYYQSQATEAERGNGSIDWAATSDSTVDLSANTANLRATAGFTAGNADIIVIDADNSELNKVYVNSGDYTGDIRVDFKKSYIDVGGWYAGHTDGTLTGDLTMRFSGDSLGGVQSTAGAGVSVFGTMNGDIDGNVYMEFSNTGFSLGSMTKSEYSVASAFCGDISGNATLVFNGGDYQYRVLGGIALNATGETNTIGGNVSVYVNGGVFQDDVIAGGLTGIIKGDSSIEITGGTFKDNIYAGAAGDGLVEGNTSILIYGCTGTFKDGITINASTDLNTQTSDASITLRGEDAAYTHSLSGFEGTLTGGNTTGTRTLNIDKANVDLSGATLTNFDSISLINASTVSLAASTNLSSTSVSVNNSSLSFAAADTATKVTVSNLTLSSGSLSIGDRVSVVENGGALTTGPGTGVWTNSFKLNLGTDASLSLSDKLNIVRSQTFTVEGAGEFSVSGIQLGTGSTDGGSTLIIEKGATMNITGADLSSDSKAAGDYAFMLGNFDCDSLITVNGTLNVNAAMSAMSGGATIAVNGTLKLNSGLDINAIGDNYGGANVSSIKVNAGGTLALGEGTAKADSEFLTVSMADGSTIKSVANTTIYEKISYAAGATISFAGEQSTLSMASAISGISANIAGSVAFTAGASLNKLNLASESTLSISSAVSADTVDNAGTIAIGTGGSLSMGANSGAGAISLDGGSLTLTSDSLNTGIIVNSVGANISVESSISNLLLDSTITYTDYANNKLSFDGGLALNIGENFALDFTTGLEIGEYTLFSNQVTAGDLSHIQITADNQYDYGYDLSVSNTGLLTLTVRALENLLIDSDYDVAGNATYDNIQITENAVISSANGSSLVTENLVTKSGVALTIESAVQSDKIINTGSIALQDGGTLTSDSLSSDSTSALVTVNNGSSMIVDDASDYVGKLVISGGSVEIGNASDATSEVKLSALSLGENASLTLADKVELVVGAGADGDKGTWTDTKSFTLNLGTDSQLSMDIQLCFYNGQTVNITGSGEFEVTGLRLSTYGAGVDSVTGGSTLNIGQGATMTVTGISTDSYETSSVNLGGWNRGENTINVEGVLNINAALTQNAGHSKIKVSGTGTLQLNEGLSFYNGTSTTKSSIELADGATLILGNETQAAKDGLAVTVGSSTIEAHGNATVYTTMSYKEGSQVSFKAGSDESLTLASAVSGTNISANISGDVTFAAGAQLSSAKVEQGASLTLNSAATIASTTLDGTVKIGSAGSITSGNITINAMADSTAVLAQVAAGTSASMSTDAMSNAAITNADVSLSDSATLSNSTIDASSNLDVQAGTLTITGESSSVSANTTLANNASVSNGLITVTGTEVAGGKSSVQYAEGGSLSTNRLQGAVVSGASVTVGSATQKQASPMMMVMSRSASTELSYDESTTIAKTSFVDSSINVVGSTLLSLDRVIISADSSINTSSESAINLNDSTIQANSSNNLTIAPTSQTGTDQLVATYTITVYDSSLGNEGTVNIGGSLSVNLFVSEGELSILEGYWSNGSLFDIAVDFGGDVSLVNSAQASDISVNIYQEGSDYAAFTMSGFDESALMVNNGLLTLTVPEPSTATLSLMALAGLLARRRRKD